MQSKQVRRVAFLLRQSRSISLYGTVEGSSDYLGNVGKLSALALRKVMYKACLWRYMREYELRHALEDEAETANNILRISGMFVPA